MIDEDGVKDVLDLGCGSGALTNTLAEKGFSVIGMDASEDMLDPDAGNRGISGEICGPFRQTDQT